MPRGRRRFWAVVGLVTAVLTLGLYLASTHVMVLMPAGSPSVVFEARDRLAPMVRDTLMPAGSPSVVFEAKDRLAPMVRDTLMPAGSPSVVFEERGPVTEAPVDASRRDPRASNGEREAAVEARRALRRQAMERQSERAAGGPSLAFDDRAPVPAPAAASSPSLAFDERTLAPLEGLWVNASPESGAVSRLALTRRGDRLLVHAWGACGATECDWGEHEASVADDVSISWVDGDTAHGLAVHPGGWDLVYTVKVTGGSQAGAASTYAVGVLRRASVPSGTAR